MGADRVKMIGPCSHGVVGGCKRDLVPNRIPWGHLIQAFVMAANPACTRNNCHGRGVVASSWSENQSPLGSKEYWPEYFYEEETCHCSKFSMLGLGILWEALEGKGMVISPNQPTLFEMAHWGCRQCKIENQQEVMAELEHYKMEIECHAGNLQTHIAQIRQRCENVEIWSQLDR